MIKQEQRPVYAGDLSYHLVHFLRPHCEQVCPQFFVVDVGYERWQRIIERIMQKDKQYVFVFDLDNTLVKTNRANNESYKDAILSVVGDDVTIKKSRFTRNDLLTIRPNLSPVQITKIVEAKEACYSKHLAETIRNEELVKSLLLLKEFGCETVLATECHRKRAQAVCEYHSLTLLFRKQFFNEDLGDKNKYQFLESIGISLESVVLFENEQSEIRKAIQYGLFENQIIKVKF